MEYAMVAAISLYLARGIGDMANGEYDNRALRSAHAKAWTLLAGVLMVVAVARG